MITVLPSDPTVVAQVAAVTRTAELGPEGMAALMMAEQERCGFAPDTALVAKMTRR